MKAVFSAAVTAVAQTTTAAVTTAAAAVATTVAVAKLKSRESLGSTEVSFLGVLYRFLQTNPLFLRGIG